MNTSTGKTRLKTFTLSLVLALGIAGCGNTGNTNPTATRATANAKDTGPKPAIVFYSAGPKPLAEALIKAFEKRTGIQVQLFQSTTGKVLGRLEAEKNNPKADVVALADWSAGNALTSQGMLLKFHPANQSQLIWEGSPSTYFGYSASALGIVYNTKLVKTPPKTWAGVLNPEWKGKVVMPDPAQSGSAVDLVGGYLQNDTNGWAYFDALSKNGVVVQGANAEALNQVLTGAKDMVLGGVDYMAYGKIAKGNPIGIVYPTDGTVVSPRPIMILKSSQHIQDDEKFVNFILSSSGQKIVAQQYLLPGVKNIPANSQRMGLNQIKSLPVNWTNLAKNKASIIQHVDNLL